MRSLLDTAGEHVVVDCVRVAVAAPRRGRRRPARPAAGATPDVRSRFEADSAAFDVSGWQLISRGAWDRRGPGGHRQRLFVGPGPAGHRGRADRRRGGPLAALPPRGGRRRGAARPVPAAAAGRPAAVPGALAESAARPGPAARVAALTPPAAVTLLAGPGGVGKSTARRVGADQRRPSHLRQRLRERRAARVGLVEPLRLAEAAGVGRRDARPQEAACRAGAGQEPDLLVVLARAPRRGVSRTAVDPAGGAPPDGRHLYGRGTAPATGRSRRPSRSAPASAAPTRPYSIAQELSARLPCLQVEPGDRRDRRADLLSAPIVEGWRHDRPGTGGACRHEVWPAPAGWRSAAPWRLIPSTMSHLRHRRGRRPDREAARAAGHGRLPAAGCAAFPHIARRRPPGPRRLRAHASTASTWYTRTVPRRAHSAARPHTGSDRPHRAHLPRLPVPPVPVLAAPVGYSIERCAASRTRSPGHGALPGLRRHRQHDDEYTAAAPYRYCRMRCRRNRNQHHSEFECHNSYAGQFRGCRFDDVCSGNGCCTWRQYRHNHDGTAHCL